MPIPTTPDEHQAEIDYALIFLMEVPQPASGTTAFQDHVLTKTLTTNDIKSLRGVAGLMSLLKSDIEVLQYRDDPDNKSSPLQDLTIPYALR